MSPEFLLGLSLFCSTPQIEEVAIQEAILECCVHRTVPRWEWGRQCEAEMRRQRLSSCALLDYLRGDYYDFAIHGPLLEEFRRWEPHERVWLLTGEGELTDDWGPIRVARMVLLMGQQLPDEVRDNAWRK